MWEFPVHEGLVLVRPDIQGFFLLNNTARQVWRNFRRGVPAPEIACRIAGRFGVSPEVALRDIEATLAGWRSGILAPSSQPPLAPNGEIATRGASSVECVVNGTPLRVLLEPGGVWEEIAPRLAPVRSPAPLPLHTFAVGAAADRVLVFRDGVCIGNEENVAAARAILLQAMASPGEPAAILHAGGCGGVLLAGHSHSGKSTLCASLMGRGLPYHCDDSAVLDRSFHVAPMPFPIALRSGSWPLIERRFPAFKDAPVHNRWGTGVRYLAPIRVNGPAPVTAIVFVRHHPTAATEFSPLGVLETLLALQNSGFWVEHTQEGIARFLAWLAGLKRYSLRYSELREAEEIVAGLATP